MRDEIINYSLKHVVCVYGGIAYIFTIILLVFKPYKNKFNVFSLAFQVFHFLHSFFFSFLFPLFIYISNYII